MSSINSRASHPTALRNAMLRKRKAQQPSRSSYWELLGTKHNKWKFGLGPRVGVGKVGAPCPFLGEWRALTKAGVRKAGAKVRANTFRLSQSQSPSERASERDLSLFIYITLMCFDWFDLFCMIAKRQQCSPSPCSRENWHWKLAFLRDWTLLDEGFGEDSIFQQSVQKTCHYTAACWTYLNESANKAFINWHQLQRISFIA